MRPNSSKLAPACFILTISLVLPCYANKRLDGGIHGTVRDGLSSALSGVTVTAVDATRRRFTTSTDQQGNFRFSNLAAGPCILIFSKGGFKELRKRNLLVVDGQSTDGSVTLEIDPTSPVTSGNIFGIITDLSGAIVPNAKITATNITNGLTLVTSSNSDGRYSLNVPAGNYRVVIEAATFKQFVLVSVNIEPGRTLSRDITLEVGAVGQQVTVTAVSGGANLDSSAPGNEDVFGRREIEYLPLINRSYEDLLRLVSGPPTMEDLDAVNYPEISMSGARTGSNHFYLDNTDNNPNGLRPTQIHPLPLSTIQKLSVADFYAADFGRYSGSLVNAVTQRAGNNLHGSLYYYHLNSELAARDFFDLNKSRFLKNDFGFTLGGPAVEDHLFIFGAYEWRRELDARPRLASVPSQSRLAEARSVVAAAGLTESRLSAELLKLFPPPDLSGTFNNRYINSPTINNTDALLIRADDNLNTDNQIHARYNFSRADALFPMAPSFFPGFRTDSSVRQDGFSISYNHTFRYRLYNEALFVFHRDKQSSAPEDHNLDPVSLGLNTGVVDTERFGLPLIKITGFDALGTPFAIPSRAVAKTWHLTDTFTGSIALHDMRGGFDFRRVYVNSRNDSGTRGRIVFDGSVLGDPLADFVAGLASGNTAIVRGDTQRGTAINSTHLFVQDTYRVRPNLTLNLGLRYEFDGVIHEDEDRLSNFIGPSEGLVQVGSQQLPKLYENDLNNFAPRLAVAWDPTNDGHSLIRANWGIFYNSPSQNLFIGLGPFTNSAVVGATTNPVGPDPVFAIRPSTPIRLTPGAPIFGELSNPATRVDLFAVEPNLETPYLQKFSLSISRQLLSNYTFDIAYVGAVGSHLYRVIDFNQPIPGGPSSRDARRPFSDLFPQVGAINMLLSAGKSNYHALTATVRRSFSRGLTVYARYTLSKSIDDASTANELPQDSRNLRSERAVSSFDQRHRFVLDWIYWFPYSEKRILDGWHISGIFEASSGSPFTPTISFDNSGTGTFADRPNRAGDPQPQMSDRTRPFNAAAFEIPPPGTFGNAGRNSLVGPGVNNWDISLNKETVLRGDVGFSLRIDFFNLFNHPNLGMPDRIVDEPSFGSINVTNTFNARRRIQIGAQIFF